MEEYSGIFEVLWSLLKHLVNCVKLWYVRSTSEYLKEFGDVFVGVLEKFGRELLNILKYFGVLCTHHS